MKNKQIDRYEAIRRGQLAGVEDVETVLAEQGRDAVLATLAPGHLEWDEAAINAGAHRYDGVPEEHLEAYYEAYARAARARAEEIAAQPREGVDGDDRFLVGVDDDDSDRFLVGVDD